MINILLGPPSDMMEMKERNGEISEMLGGNMGLLLKA